MSCFHITCFFFSFLDFNVRYWNEIDWPFVIFSKEYCTLVFYYWNNFLYKLFLLCVNCLFIFQFLNFHNISCLRLYISLCVLYYLYCKGNDLFFLIIVLEYKFLACIQKDILSRTHSKCLNFCIAFNFHYR